MRSKDCSWLIAAWAMGAASAFAAPAIQAGATLSQLSFSLTDLRPADGVSPSFKAVLGEDTTSVTLNAWEFAGEKTNALATSVFSSTSGAVNGVSRTGTADVVASAKTAGGVSSTLALGADTLSLYGNLVMQSEWLSMSMTASTSSYLNWVLSPGTQLTVTGRAQLHASIDPQQPIDKNLGLTASTAYSVTLANDNYQVLDSESNLFSVTQLGTKWGAQAGEVLSQQSDDLFSLTYANTGTTAMRVVLRTSTTTYNTWKRGAATPLPVPEPGTWALMALGLLGMGVVVRQQRRPDMSRSG